MSMGGLELVGTRCTIKNASEICLPQASGFGVDRLPGYALYVDGGIVQWIGPEGGLPTEAQDAPVYDCEGRAVVPGLVDCHTHLVFGGDRIEDFCRRARGLTYGQIALEGGGIQTTVRQTRAASFSDLVEGARGRLEARLAYGITTTEIKSGYGLSVSHELRMLEVVETLKNEGWDVEGTLLAAHAVPKDQDRNAYVELIVTVMIPEVARRGLARFVDVFIEDGAYTKEEGARIFEAARTHGLTPRVHADQLSSGGGAELAAHVQAASADHLENISEEGLLAMAQTGVIGVLLPGALAYIGDYAPGLGRRLIDAGVTVAVATDTNPGSSPTQNLPLMGTLATTQLGLTAEEALRAMTLGGAQALRRPDVGSLAPGCQARFILLDATDSRALVSSFGEPIVRQIVVCAEPPSPPEA